MKNKVHFIYKPTNDQPNRYVVCNYAQREVGFIFYDKNTECHRWTQRYGESLSSRMLKQIEEKCVELDGGILK